MTATTPAPADVARAPRRGPKEHRSGQMARRQARAGWLFSVPFLLVFAVFMAGPVLASLGMSLSDIRSTDIRAPFETNFVGIDNFRYVFSDDLFWTSLRNTAVFVLVGVPLTLVMGLAVAVALDRGIKHARSAFRLGYYAPVVTSIVAVAVVWRFILQPDGLLNTVLGWVGISGPNWLADPFWALPALIMMAVWRNVGTLMVIFLAGLQSVDQQVQEAAMTDGANAWQRFRFMTLPALRPAALFGGVITGIGFIQFFEEPFVMTQGGPLDATFSVAYYTYDQFSFGNYGTASAASYIMFALVALLTLVQFRLLRERG